MTKEEMEGTLNTLLSILQCVQEDEDATDHDIGNMVLDVAEDMDMRIREVRTFQEAGVLTTDNGIVIRGIEGEEFRLTIGTWVKW